MFCGIDSIVWNISHIQTECGEYFEKMWRKNARVTMEFKVSKRHNLRPTLSTDMVQRILQ